MRKGLSIEELGKPIECPFNATRHIEQQGRAVAVVSGAVAEG